MSAPIVQVLFKGRMLKSISFEGDTLRIGRLRDNEVVIDNLSVSRFHAQLTRDGERIWVEDCGSENGCFVNGMRVERAEVKPGDEILIGKHQLVLRAPGEVPAEPPEPAPPGPAQPWDAAKTYMMGPETMSGALGDKAPPAPLAAPALPASDPPRPEPAAEPRGPVPRAAAAPSVADPPALAEDFDVSMDDIPEVLEEDAPDPLSPDASERPAAPDLYPGFVMQTEGRFDRVLRWEGERLTLGRSAECDIVLSHPEVSRRHALFHRDADRFEVRDLDSINGTLVNGERVKRHELAVGDVVKIEHFEFTFVLENHPLGEEIKTDTLPPKAPEPRDNDVTVLEEVSPFAVSRPSPLDELTEPTPVPEAPATPAPPNADPDPTPVPVAPPEPPRRSREAPRTRPPAAPRRFTAPPAAAGGEAWVTLELRLRADDLPEALREALEQAEDGSLPLQAELRLRRDG